MEFSRDLIGKCGIYCGACRSYILKKCKACLNLYVAEEAKCPYYNCVRSKAMNSCGECQEFPCEKHYGPMAVYAKMFLDWKKRELQKT